MKVSYHWLKEYVTGTLPQPERLRELFTKYAFEVESVEKFGTDSIFDIAVLPNRAHDCLSHEGVAREAAALTECSFAPYEPELLKESKKSKASDLVSVTITASKLCAWYGARVVTGVKVGPSPKWLREKLEALGQRSVNNIVDATNFVMFATGQPLHAFDCAKISGDAIVVRAAKKGEKVTVLGGETYELSPADCVIADTVGALAIGGVKGGMKAEVTTKTKDIVLECASFDSSAVRATARRLGLRTDASVRFENGVPQSIAARALDHGAELVLAVAGGEVARGVVSTGALSFGPRRVFFTEEGVNRLLGVNIPGREMRAILERLGFVVKKTAKGYQATVPSHRLDVSHDADIAEEIGRLYGLEDIFAVLPRNILLPAHEDAVYSVSEKIKRIAAGMGMTEAYTRSFIGEADVALFHYLREKLVSVQKPFSQDQKYLRPSLLPKLLQHAAANLRRMREVRMFEVGNIFCVAARKKVQEETVIAGVVALPEDAEAHQKGMAFYEAKGAVEMLLEKLGIDDVSYSFHEHDPFVSEPFWHPARAAELKCGDMTIGRVAELSSSIARALGISGRIAFFGIRVAALAERAQERSAYAPISKFPAVERDIAVLVLADTRIDEAQGVIENAGGELLYDSDLFDIYEGEHLEADRKSLAFHLIFQSNERTLTDKEVDAVYARIVSALSEQGFEVRS